MTNEKKNMLERGHVEVSVAQSPHGHRSEAFADLAENARWSFGQKKKYGDCRFFDLGQSHNTILKIHKYGDQKRLKSYQTFNAY